MEFLIKTFESVGLTVKDIDENTYSVSGRLVAVNKVDLDGDQFLKTTDFGLDDISKSVVYYHHGLDDTIKKTKLGSGTLEQKDSGDIWIEAQLSKRSEYEKQVYTLAKTGKLGWSSGTLPHLAEYQYIEGVKTWVKWPLGLDASLTPTPAEYSNSAFVKSVEKAVETAVSVAVEKQFAELKSKGNEMSNEQTQNSNEPVTQNALQEFTVKFEGKLETVGKQLETLVTRLEQLPTKSKAGFVSESGGNTDKTVKSFGDFLVAVKRRDTLRLKTVYGSEYVDPNDTTKAVTVDVGTTGGYAVPHAEATNILQIATNSSEFLPLVTRVPVTTFSGSYPALDQTIAPTAGSGETSMAADVTATERNPGGSFTETTPQFTELQWEAKEIGGYTQVQKEFSADSPLGIEALLRSLFGIAVGAKNERNLFRGSGVGNEWLGILNSPCAVDVSPANNSVFAWVDALNMLAHLKVLNPSAVKWAIHSSILPDIGQFETTGGGGVLQSNMQDALGMRIAGKPIGMSEHLPQANSSGCVVLGDFSAYLMFMRNELMIDYSEHVGFLTGKDTWRFYQRSDGKPWLKNKITLADPQGSYYVSPFVYFND